jgi:hypothetical protein
MEILVSMVNTGVANEEKVQDIKSQMEFLLFVSLFNFQLIEQKVSLTELVYATLQLSCATCAVELTISHSALGLDDTKCVKARNEIVQGLRRFDKLDHFEHPDIVDNYVRLVHRVADFLDSMPPPQSQVYVRAREIRSMYALPEPRHTPNFPSFEEALVLLTTQESPVGLP